MAGRSIKTGTIKDISGEVNIAGGDLYKGYTAEQVSVLLSQITSTFQPKPYDGRCPYKGLDDFEEEDAELFFGRERLVEGLVGRLNDSRILFITGPSGSGKSSLVRAGLIPAWKGGALKGLHSEGWCYETLKPGREPLEAWRPEDLIAVTCKYLSRNLTGEEWQFYTGDVPYQAICPNLPIEPNP